MNDPSAATPRDSQDVLGKPVPVASVLRRKARIAYYAAGLLVGLSVGVLVGFAIWGSA